MITSYDELEIKVALFFLAVLATSYVIHAIRGVVAIYHEACHASESVDIDETDATDNPEPPSKET